MTARWKLDPIPTGLGAVGAAPRCSRLREGSKQIATVQAIGGGWQGPVSGWFWYGMGQNTFAEPCATEAEAKAEALAYYKASLVETPNVTEAANGVRV